MEQMRRREMEGKRELNERENEKWVEIERETVRVGGSVGLVVV